MTDNPRNGWGKGGGGGGGGGLFQICTMASKMMKCYGEVFLVKSTGGKPQIRTHKHINGAHIVMVKMVEIRTMTMTVII